MSSNKTFDRLSYSTTSDYNHAPRGSTYRHQHIRRPINSNMQPTPSYPDGRNRATSLTGYDRMPYIETASNTDGGVLIDSTPPAPIVRPQRRASVAGSHSSRPSLPFLPAPALDYVANEDSNTRRGRSSNRQAGSSRGASSATLTNRPRSPVDSLDHMRRRVILDGFRHGRGPRPSTLLPPRAAVNSPASQLTVPTALSRRRNDAGDASAQLSDQPPPYWQAQLHETPAWRHVERPMSSVRSPAIVISQASSSERCSRSNDRQTTIRSARSQGRVIAGQAGAHQMFDPYGPPSAPSSYLEADTTAVGSSRTNRLYYVEPSPYYNAGPGNGHSLYSAQSENHSGSLRSTIDPSDSISHIEHGARGLRRMAATAPSSYLKASSAVGNSNRTDRLYHVDPSPYSNAVSGNCHNVDNGHNENRYRSLRSTIDPSESISNIERGARGLRRMAASLSLASTYGDSSYKPGSGRHSKRNGTLGVMNVRLPGGTDVEVMEIPSDLRSRRGRSREGRERRR